MRSRWLALVFFAAACNNGLCARHSDCPSGERCTLAGTCSRATPDAAPEPAIDAGADDAADASPDAVPDAAPDGGP